MCAKYQCAPSNPILLYIEFRDQSGSAIYVAQWICGVDNYRTKNNKSKKHTKHCNKVSELLWTVACPSIELVQLQTTATMTLKSYRLNHSSTRLCFALPHSTMGSTWLLYSTTLYHCFTFFYLTLTHFTIAILESTWVDTTLDTSLIWLHLTLLRCIKALCESIWLCYSLPCLDLTTTWLYYALPWPNCEFCYTLPLTQLDFFALYHGSMWLYYTLPC